MASPVIDPDLRLPSSEELPCSDETPVDNENQNTLPNWLLETLRDIWQNRQDWFFGVDMGIYDRAAQRQRAPRIIPDGFLSLGVQRHKRNGRGRLSYVLQEEQDIAPILALEMVSQTYGQEYDKKMATYAQLGVTYYVIYNPEYSQRHQHEPFEVYKNINQTYQRQAGEPVWMPEINLGIGRVRGQLEGIEREWLAWHNQAGEPYLLPEQRLQAETERAAAAQEQAQQAQRNFLEAQERVLDAQAQTEQERQRAEQERLRAEQERQEKLQLLEKLKALGIDPQDL